MCWRNFCIFLVLARVVCELNIAMCSSRTSAMKRTDRRAIGTECQGCGKLFGTLFAYDQHRRSKQLRGTACCALPDENRMIVTAAPRPNMSTAALERRPAQRTRGGGQPVHILHILQIKHIWHMAMILQRAYPRGVGPLLDCIFFIFLIF
jgi:hypothetical protein